MAWITKHCVVVSNWENTSGHKNNLIIVLDWIIVSISWNNMTTSFIMTSITLSETEQSSLLQLFPQISLLLFNTNIVSIKHRSTCCTILLYWCYWTCTIRTKIESKSLPLICIVIINSVALKEANIRMMNKKWCKTIQEHQIILVFIQFFTLQFV